MATRVLKSAYRRYTAGVCGAIALACALMLALNSWVDPYAMRASDAFRFKGARPALEDFSRLFKVYAVARIKPEGLILGTSRADHGLDPANPSWRPAHTRVFNSAIDGANAVEFLAYLKHAATQGALRTVVLGLDYGSFERFKPQATFDRSLLDSPAQPHAWRRAVNLAAMYLSWSALRDSLDSLSTNHPITTSHDLQSGRRLDDVYRQRIAKFGGAREAFLGYARYTVTRPDRSRSEDVWPDPAAMQAFRALVRFSRAHHIDLRVYFSPAHAIETELYLKKREWSTIERWKSDIVSIVVAESGGRDLAGQRMSPFPVWDFSGYNVVTTQALPPTRVTNFGDYWEHSHFKPRLGDQILNLMLTDPSPARVAPGGFGFLITRANLAEHLAAIRHHRQQYLTSDGGRADLTALAEALDTH